MANIASKNPFDALGNDPEEGSDAERKEPTKTAEKPLPRTTKRNAPDVTPTGPRAERTGRGGRRGGAGDDARPYGNTADRFKPKDDGLREDRHPDRIKGGHQNWSPENRGGHGSRGGRGGRGVRDDRHSRMGRTDTEKEVAQGWGGTRGEDEWQDEKAGEAIAQADEKDASRDAAPAVPVDAEGNHPEGEGEGDQAAAAAAPAPEPEPEDNTKSYADYLAELAAKKLDFGVPEARKPNENAKPDKKWAQAKELKRDEEDEALFAGGNGKPKRERPRKERTYLDIETRPVDPPRGGGREGGRGGRGRGEGRGEFRGRGGGRGGFRGRGGGGGGEHRGDRGGDRGGDHRAPSSGGRGNESVNVTDPAAFPSLGQTNS